MKANIKSGNHEGWQEGWQGKLVRVRRQRRAGCAVKSLPSLIRPGGDLVEATNAQLGIRLGDLEGHAVDITRRRIWLAVLGLYPLFLLCLARGWRILLLVATGR